MGLVITRRIGESFKIGEDITVTIIDVSGTTARIRIEAPREVPIHRSEHYAGGDDADA